MVPDHWQLYTGTRELGTLGMTNVISNFALHWLEISITLISFHSTYTWKFARKKRTRSWSSYKALVFFLRQKVYADSGYV